MEINEVKAKVPVTRKPFYSQSFDDLQATALSINYDGSFLLLAGRRHLALQNLNNFSDELKLFHRNSKFEVSCAEFAICEKSSNNCAIATSQLIEVVTWRESDPL
jgi:WD repeat-containing protein 59